MARRRTNAPKTIDEGATESVVEVISQPSDSETEKKPAKSKSNNKFVVSCDGVLRVRKGPGIGYEILEELPSGTEVEVIDTKEGWAKIGSDRWVAKEFLK